MFIVLSVASLRRVYPRGNGRKQSLLVLAALALIAAGCGGGGGAKQTTTQATGTGVAGTGFVFRAPDGWTVKTALDSASATQGSDSVTVFVLTTLKTYKPALFAKSIAELDRIARSLAAQSKGKVTASRTVRAAGGRARQYDIAAGAVVDQYTFVFRDKREYQLTCQWPSGGSPPAACDQLVSSFSFR